MSTRHLVVLSLSAACLLGCQKLSLRPQREESAQSHYRRGQGLLDQGKYDSALEELAKAIAANPEHAKAQTAIGDIYRRKGDHALAATHYQLACQADPYAFKPHYNLGVTYQVLADAAADTVQAGNYLAKAVGVYIRALAIRPENFDSQLNLGACYYQLGKYRLAEDHTRTALTLNPQSTRACNNLAFIYIGMDDPERAILMLKRSLELDGSQPEILTRLGLCYLETRRPGLALGAYRAAQRKLPNSPDPWTQMGVCYFRLKKFDDAMASFQNALRLDRRHAPAYRGIGVVCIYHYVIDNSRTDLLKKGLLAWKYCLKLHPGQEDLRKLVERYTEIAVRRGANSEIGRIAPPKQADSPGDRQQKATPASPRPTPKPSRPRAEPAENPLAAPEPPATAWTPVPQRIVRRRGPSLSTGDGSAAKTETRAPAGSKQAATPVQTVPAAQAAVEPETVGPESTATTKQPVARAPTARKTMRTHSNRLEAKAPHRAPSEGKVAERHSGPLRPMPARSRPVDRHDERTVAGPEPVRASIGEPLEAKVDPVRSTRQPTDEKSPKRKPKVLWTDPPPLSESLSRRDKS
jgi:tetratricopeptide (TPR) repeat protein